MQLIFFVTLLLGLKPFLASAEGVQANSVLELVRNLQSRSHQEKEQEARTLVELIRTQPTLANKRVLASLGAHFVEINPRLASQYFSMAKNAAHLPGSEAIDAEISYYQSLIHVNRGAYDKALGRLGILVGSVSFGSDTESLWRKIYQLYLFSLIQIGDMERYLPIFEKCQRRFPQIAQKEDFIKYGAEVYFKRGMKRKYLRSLEQLSQSYPVSKASIWAFNRLLEYSVGSDQSGIKYVFPMDLLRKISRSRSLYEGTREALIRVFDSEVNVGGKRKLLKGLDRISGLLSIREYGLALMELNEMKNEGRFETNDQLRVWYLLGKIHGALGNHRYAAYYWDRYFSEQIQITKHRRRLERYAHHLSRLARHDSAIETYQTMSRLWRHHKKYRWHYFWESYLSGDLQQTLRLLDKKGFVVAIDPGEPDAAKYWRAQIYLRLGQKDKAFKIFRSIVNRDDGSYYATMIVSSHPNWSYQEGFRLAEKASRTSRVQPHHRIRLASLSQSDAGVFIDLNEEDLDWDPDLERSEFPLAYDEILTPLSEYLGIDKYLVLSIMRAESHYRPDVRSSVGARGLIQLMPYTGLKVARLLNDDEFEIEKLGNPSLNLAYGTFYLNRLLRYYQGNYFLAIAAYNAGPHAVNRWLKSCDRCGTDEFVEAIPYRETRRYVKKVIRFLGAYKRIYQGGLGIGPIPSVNVKPAEELSVF